MVGKLLNRSTLNCLLTRQITSSAQANKKTAGIIVIGNEILNGDVRDTNSNYITKTLYKLGIRVEKISVIPDKINDIAEETKLFSKHFTYVITTGGIGPTHDDVTFEGVAQAFNKDLIYHPILVELCTQYFKTDDLNAPGMKLAKVPETSKLTFAEDFNDRRAKYPNVSIENVYIFPGIPQLLEYGMDTMGSTLFSAEQKFFAQHLYFNVTENFIVEFLNQIVQEYPEINLGSYPVVQNDDYKVRIKIESDDEALTMAATHKLLNIVPKHFIV